MADSPFVCETWAQTRQITAVSTAIACAILLAICSVAICARFLGGCNARQMRCRAKRRKA
jgi:hypothetical protein